MYCNPIYRWADNRGPVAGTRCSDMFQRQKGVKYTLRRHALGSCSGDKWQGQNRDICTHMKMFWVHVSGICFSDFMGHVAGQNHPQTGVAQLEKYQFTRWDMSLQHIAETCTRDTFICVRHML